MGIISIVKQNATHLRQKHQLVKRAGLLKILGKIYLFFLVLLLLLPFFPLQSHGSLIGTWLGITLVFLFILGIVYFLTPFPERAFLNTNWVNRKRFDAKKMQQFSIK